MRSIVWFIIWVVSISTCLNCKGFRFVNASNSYCLWYFTPGGQLWGLIVSTLLIYSKRLITLTQKEIGFSNLVKIKILVGLILYEFIYLLPMWMHVLQHQWFILIQLIFYFVTTKQAGYCAYHNAEDHKDYWFFGEQMVIEQSILKYIE